MADQADAQQGGDAPAALGSQWSEHNAPNGRKYYYNSVTGESTWERCVPLVPCMRVGVCGLARASYTQEWNCGSNQMINALFEP